MKRNAWDIEYGIVCPGSSINVSFSYKDTYDFIFM